MKTIKQLLITIAVLLCSTTTYAYDFEVDGIYYNIISLEDLTVEVTNGYNKYIGNIIIPTTVAYKENVLTVIGIRGSAFSGCSALTSITIPNSITSIGVSAFDGCTSLKTLRFEDGTETLNLGYEPSDNLYLYHNGLFNDCPLDTLYLGRNISYEATQYYGYSPFCGQKLESITISDRVTNIGKYAFYNCGLTSIEIPNSVTSIGDYAFYGCGLTSITFMDNVTSIRNSAFANCTNLNQIFMLSRIAKSYISNIFSTETYNNAILYVPQGSRFTYSKTTPWSNFYIEELNSYNVTYKIDGEVYETYSVEYFMEIPIPETPTKEGYTFSGWSDIPESMPAQDITIEGSFIANIYEITYIVDGEVYNVQSVACDAIIPDIEEPVKEGYTFSGWSEIPKTMPAEDVIVTGSFSINSYDLVYLVDDEEYKRITLEFGSEILPEEEPVKEGYTFSGWSEIPETMPAHDVTITGSFSINSYDLVYMIDGEEYKRVTLEFGSEIIPEEEPIKEGYTFSGWSEIPETMPAEDVTVTGSFSINSYDLVYMVDGEEYKRMTLEFGSKVVPEEEPTKEGYTFSGWSNIPEAMPARNVTVTGSFSINSYDLVYMVDGEEYKRVTLEFGSKIIPEEEPEKEGYTFSGWSNIPETMPARNVTVTGSFSINSYDLVYMIDGEEYKRVTLEFGSEIVPEEEPTKEGYTFSGWSNIPETMPAHDVEVTGSFIPTNVSEITAEVSLQINGNNITLSNANNNTVAIYSINGMLVKKIDKYTGEEITLEKGVYIVSVGDKAMKIKL